MTSVPPEEDTRPSILYIDSERYGRQAFAFAFRESYPIVLANNVQDGVGILGSHVIGVLVANIGSKAEEVYEALTSIKETNTEIVRIMVTPPTEHDTIMRFVGEGLVARYILKPWKREELEPILKWAMETYEVGRKDDAVQSRILKTERLVTLGSIGAAVVHDLKQPLAYLSNNCQRINQLAPATPALRELLEKHGSSLPENDRILLDALSDELSDIGQDMAAGCEVMNELTENLRTISRPQEGDRICAPLPVMRYAVSACRGAALKARCKVVHEDDEELPKVQIGTTQLTQILVNLLNNAVQALERTKNRRGRVHLEATTTSLAPEEGDGTPIEMVKFSVQDNGPGIEPDTLEKLGTLFFTTRAEGTGLGISQCKRLTSQAQGEFEIDSVVGTGTTVSVYLPIVKES